MIQWENWFDIGLIIGLIMEMCSVKKHVIKLFATLNQNAKRKNWFDNWFNFAWKMKSFFIDTRRLIKRFQVWNLTGTHI